MIHKAFLEFNWTGHPRCVNVEPSFLPQQHAWYTSIEDKPDHVKDGMFYEAQVYGELIVMNGEFLEYLEDDEALLFGLTPGNVCSTSLPRLNGLRTDQDTAADLLTTPWRKMQEGRGFE